LAHILVGEPASTSPGYALIDLDAGQPDDLVVLRHVVGHRGAERLRHPGPRLDAELGEVGAQIRRLQLAMIFKLAEAAAKTSWRRLNGPNQLSKLILGVKFADGIEVVRPQAQAAAA
jgi:hypothetical protein